jgi:formate hydrogenlyase subunit 6/NADH:ubiquinone oxidoreductase subunit I
VRACYDTCPVGGIEDMLKVDYEKLRQLDTEPLIEFEQQILDKMKRELEAKKRGDDKKKKGKRGRR